MSSVADRNMESANNTLHSNHTEIVSVISAAKSQKYQM